MHPVEEMIATCSEDVLITNLKTLILGVVGNAIMNSGSTYPKHLINILCVEHCDYFLQTAIKTVYYKEHLFNYLENVRWPKQFLDFARTYRKIIIWLKKN